MVRLHRQWRMLHEVVYKATEEIANDTPIGWSSTEATEWGARWAGQYTGNLNVFMVVPVPLYNDLVTSYRLMLKAGLR